MKKVLTINFVLTAFLSSAQMKTLFFNEDVQAIGNLVDSVKSVLPGYDVDTQYIGKSGHNFIVKLSNKKTEWAVINVSHFNKRIYLCDITGTNEAIIPVYRRYFLSKVEFNTCAPLLLQPLKDSRKLPISFCRSGELFTISSRTPY